MTRTKLYSLCERWKDSEFFPSVVNSEGLVDTALGVGESDTRKPSVSLNNS